MIGPVPPPLPDLNDEAACDDWIERCTPQDGETISDGVRRVTNGALMLMRELMRRMSKLEKP